MNKLIFTLKDLAFFIVLMVLLVTFSTFIVINAVWLYAIVVASMGLASKYHLTFSLLIHNFWNMVSYLQNPFQSKLVLHGFTMSAKGFHHFSDVKTLILVNNLALVISVIVILIFLFGLGFKRYLWKFDNMIKGTAAFISVFGLFCAFDFNEVFVDFHRLLFRNNDWMFNPKTEPIINVLPDQYFMWAFVLFMLVIVIGLVIVYTIGKRQIKKDL